ncbi:MAG TPA: TPM domain-containing protein [Bacteroidales bacterium]|nr:TPM domain-containing protein [Bacteroidales bacterium]
MNPDKFFSSEEKEKIVKAIEEAEMNTSGEIRIHLEGDLKGDVLDRASYIFEKLEIHKTALRNGVLFYLAVNSQKFAILGDAGINSKVPANFWDTIKEKMGSHFRQGDFVSGLCEGIIMTGEQLKAHFPYQEDDVNELSDEISFGKS